MSNKLDEESALNLGLFGSPKAFEGEYLPFRSGAGIPSYPHWRLPDTEMVRLLLNHASMQRSMGVGPT